MKPIPVALPVAPEPPAALPITPPLPGVEAPKDLFPAYSAWRAAPSPVGMAGAIKELDPLIRSELSKYRGVLPEAALYGQGKKTAIEAIKSFKPDKGAKLSTHLVNQLQKIYRENYKYQQAIRLSEELQRGVGALQRAKDDLTFRLMREPNAAEIADELAWPISRVERTQRQARGEIFGSDLEFDPVDETTTQGTDYRLDLVYHDLTPIDKTIMELSTGYGGSPTITKKEIAAKLKLSQAAVTQRAKKISTRIADTMGWKI